MENDDRTVSRLRHNIVLQHILDMTLMDTQATWVAAVAGVVTWEGAKISSWLCYYMLKNETNKQTLWL
jgi:hypothetical protein